MAQDPKVILFALSTCPYCHRAKEFMERRKIRFEPVFVDLLKGEEKAKAVEAVQEANPKLSFPTIVVGSGGEREVLVGMSEDIERELLRLCRQ